jgi:nucleoside-diphosphate-sugar epimerase
MNTEHITILGCGWLGLPLASSWVAEGKIVRGSTTSYDKTLRLNALHIESSVIDLATVEEETLKNFVDGRVLVVTVPPRSRSQEPNVYLHHMKKLVQVLQRVDVLEHVVYTSSTSVYPDVSGLVKEEDLQYRDQAFNHSLFDVEQLFLSLEGKKVSVLRLGGLTGGSRMLAKHFAGKSGIQGGMQPVNLIHQDDAVGVIRFMIAQKLSGVYNVCAPMHPFKKDFYTQLCQRYHLALPQFKEEQTVGKSADVKKLLDAGYSFLYPDPYSFSYEV